MKIIVDSREASKNRQIIEGLQKLGVEILIEELPVGDYYIHGIAIIERKTSVDLVHSIRSKRLWDELFRINMLEELEKYLLIEGSLALIEKFTKWSPNSVVGTVLSISNMGIKLFFSPSRKWTIIFLYQLAKKSEKIERKIYPIRIVKKSLTLPEIQQAVLEGIPGVGPTHAIKLLQYFKTIRNIANAKIDDLLCVEGIGLKRAEEIYRVFNEKYKIINNINKRWKYEYENKNNK